VGGRRVIVLALSADVDNVMGMLAHAGAGVECDAQSPPLDLRLSLIFCLFEG
jgi:hypothetical protein